MMEFRYETLQTCSQSTGMVVVIDVIRAFTTAAFAFAAGADSITLVSTVEEATRLRDQIPNALIMGEVMGLPPEGFDFGNSPAAFLDVDLNNRHLIQRTSAGTQGVVNSSGAETLLASSFCCARATVDYIKIVSPKAVSFVITGLGPDGRGEEDLACAEYLEALLKDLNANSDSYLKRVTESRAGQFFADPENIMFSWQDIECCLDIDRFNFALEISREDDRLVMIPTNYPKINNKMKTK
jgi:2-phosphosulfolactate phosphatase